MTAVLDQLMRADRHGRPVGEVVRHHLLEGVLRRVARLDDPAGFVLRGGMLTRMWVAPNYRRAQDLDFVGTFPFDVAETGRRFAPVLATHLPDGVAFDPVTLDVRGIWLESEFPGVRLSFRLGLGEPDTDLTVDVGFNDPLVPPVEPVEYPLLLGDGARLWCAAPETMAGWKLHGLAEKGPRRWRPKDLADLYLMARTTPLRDGLLPEAVRVAFVSRGFTAADARSLFGQGSWWEAKTAQVRWADFCRSAPELAMPRDLQAVVRAVNERFDPAIRMCAVTTPVASPPPG